MTQNEVLVNLIHDNQLTDYGREHHFDLIKTWDDYNKYVPLTSYADYEPLVEEMKRGKKNVLTAYPLACMLLTSGSSGNPKSIPLTGKALQQYSSLIFSNLLDKVPDGKLLHTSVFRYPLERKLCGKGSGIVGADNYSDDHQKSYYSANNCSEDNSESCNSDDKCSDDLPEYNCSDAHPESYNALLSAVYFAYLVQIGAMNLDRFVGGEKLNFSFEIADVMFVKAWSALYEKNLVGIQSIFMYDGLMLFDYIENSGLAIVRYMKERRIPDEIQVSQEIKDYLIENMVPDDARIAELETILSGFYEGIAQRLWPNLQLVSGISGMFFESRERLLKKYTGDVPLHYFAFVSSECMSGVALDGTSARYKLISDNGYYEFLDTACHVYNCSNVPIGRKLELVITNWSGLYRYRTGDIVMVDEFQDGMPVIHFVNRDKLAINIAGEKTSEEMLGQAIRKLRQADDLKIFECSVWMDYDDLPGRYVLLMELNTEDSKNLNQADFTSKLATDFDTIMKEVNPDYEDLRNLQAINIPVVRILPKGYHAAHRRQSSQAKPGLIGQQGDLHAFIQ